MDLALPAAQLIDGVDAVFLSHLHLDHYDDAAREVLPKRIKVFVQDGADKEKVGAADFTNVEVLTDRTEFEGVTLSKTMAQHGRGEILKRAGQVCGVVFKHPGEKTVYVAADTVWFEGVREAIDAHRPDVIVVNGGDNQFFDSGSLIGGMMTVSAGSFAITRAVRFMENAEWAIIDIEFQAQRGGMQLAQSGVDLLRFENDQIAEARLFSSDQDAEDAFWGR